MIPTIWHPAYTSNAAPLTSTTKAQFVVDRAQEDKLIGLFPTAAPVLADVWKEIATVHDPAYVQAVQTGTPRELAESQLFTWSEAFADSVARIWVGQRSAVSLALAKAWPFVLHPVSGAHHARPERGSGFCTFNFVVGGFVEELTRGMRCGVIDLDAHFGDGTWAFKKRGGIYDHLRLFDLRAGEVNTVLSTAQQRGDYSSDIHGYYKTGDALLFQVHDHLERWLDATKLGCAVYQAGMDPYEHDAMGGVPGADKELLWARDAHVLNLLAERQIPTVVIFAGGYSTDVVDLHLGTIREIAQLSA